MSTIDTIMADVSKVARLIEPAFAFIAIAQRVTGLGGDAGAEAIQVLDAAVKAFERAAEGTLTNEQVMAELGKLAAGLQANDAGADAALASRFPGSGG